MIFSTFAFLDIICYGVFIRIKLLKYLRERGNMQTEILQVRSDILFHDLFNEKDIKAAIMGSISDLRM